MSMRDRDAPTLTEASATYRSRLMRARCPNCGATSNPGENGLLHRRPCRGSTPARPLILERAPRPPWDPRPRGLVQPVIWGIGLAVAVAVSAAAELLDRMLRRGR